MEECGDCTACCTLSVVPEINKRAWEKCTHCVNNGCSIYEKRPQLCKDFECAYLQGGKDIKFRPDKCGVMFVKRSERIFSGILVPDTPISDTAKRQISSFKEQGYSVVMLKRGEKPHIELAENHNKEKVYNEYLNILKNGNV